MQLPGPVRAAVGLAANLADEARHLPDRAIELPMLAVSTVLQMSLRAQQRYAMLTARGDEVLSGSAGDEPPEWATFDDPVDDAPFFDGGPNGGFDGDGRADAAAILDQIFGSFDGAAPLDGSGDHSDADADADADLTPPTPISEAPSAPARRSGTSDDGGGTATGRSAGAKATKSAKRAAKKSPARTAAKKASTPSAKAASKPARSTTPATGSGDTDSTGGSDGKRVNKPRHTTPSKFDDVDD